MDNETTPEPTAKDLAGEALEAKMEAEFATEGLIDDESEDGTDAEDSLEDVTKIDHSGIMNSCQQAINSCNDDSLKTFFKNNKAFYDASTCEETKEKIACRIEEKLSILKK